MHSFWDVKRKKMSIKRGVKRQKLCLKRGEKRQKLCQKILFSTPQINESIPFLFFSRLDEKPKPDGLYLSDTFITFSR